MAILDRLFGKKKPVKYLGWISGSENDEELLRSLGITGKMNYKNGVFEMCEIPVDRASEVISRLYEEYPQFYTIPFTGVDEDGKPICGLNPDNGQPSYNDEWRKRK